MEIVILFNSVGIVFLAIRLLFIRKILKIHREIINTISTILNLNIVDEIKKSEEFFNCDPSLN